MSRLARTAMLLLMIALLCRKAAAQIIAVRDNANVRSANIQLSDLLDNPGPTLATLARSIDLGRSPQPGSQRVLAGEQIARQLSSEPRFGVLRIPERIIVRTPGWEISRKAVWSVLAQYLRDRGWPDEQMPDPSAIHWPYMIRAAQPDTPLRITKTEWSAARHILQVHARCTYATACGSFLVEAPMTTPPPEVRKKSGEPGRNMAASHKGVHALPSDPLLLAGKRATLILESEGMRITIPVIALERGAMGQNIRVREWNGQRIYHAEVAGPGAARASL